VLYRLTAASLFILQSIDINHRTIGVAAGNFLGCKGYLSEFPQICPKNFLRQTFSLQMFCIYWFILFSSTMLP